jgi:hypothetical protein
MARPELCQYRRPEDDARCVLNAHDESSSHAVVPSFVDARLYLLDDLAETFKRTEQWEAYHHVRAVAHGLDFHLSSCTHGLRAVPHPRITA